MTDPHDLLAREDAAWCVLHDLFESIPQGRFQEPTVTPQGWAAKDMMFHVGAWLAECARVLDRIREGTFVPGEAEDGEALNRAWFEMSKGMDLRDVRATFEGARRQARAVFATLPTVTTDAWEWFEESAPLHYESHASDLEGWLGRAPGGSDTDHLG